MSINPSRYSAAHQMVAALEAETRSRREWLLELDDLTTAELALPETALLLIPREIPKERIALYGRLLYDRSWLMMVHGQSPGLDASEFACSPYSSASYILSWMWSEKSNNPEAEVALVNCPRCKATGLINAGTRPRPRVPAGKVATLCQDCRGTGCAVATTAVFRGRIPLRRRYSGGVFAANPGGMISGEIEGGVSEDTWERNPDSVYDWGREARQIACPAWWRALVNGPVSVDWPECQPRYAGAFPTCPKFTEKEECWRKYDAETEKLMEPAE